MPEPIGKIHVYQTSIGRVLWAMTPAFEDYIWDLVDREEEDFEVRDAIYQARQAAGLKA